ncbi:hypothetical protein AVEN_127285-1 [Araneus ventricosus]|uniref:DUF7041 domain-containing protein n=1 Tax=Araneus ventricosus TaxID=182803 RepID=A0A4Y2N6Q9_ARAVE|nr:hypothetical protein AVEN_103878-1 [Araneus ventricosus]GBN34588.1 hypothetical protein AVEN_136453-1 [Araneus ventricosus]GBN34608.1 hypothetical protein AVEN_30666-1 [Araneus ventricosus]GBN34620.1 hypothetical protein AVEN_127285-1 [Araneus ventricosus]
MSDINAVQIPVFNRSDPGLWFVMCESTFALATPKAITESVTKYNYIVSHLPPDSASLIRDVLMKPDAADPYSQIKKELINRSGESSQHEIRKLLSGEELAFAVFGSNDFNCGFRTHVRQSCRNCRQNY